MKQLIPFAIVTLLVITVWGCKEPEKEETPPEAVKQEIAEEIPETAIYVRVPDYQFSFGSLALNQHLDSMDLRAFKHYGEFYTEDFSIYTLGRIDYLAEAYFIDDINLYFIDSVLVKVQAFLREDRSNEFISKYGKAKIFISDAYNKSLLKDEKLVTRVNGKMQINDKLDQYRLKWTRETADIYYEVNKKMDSLQVANGGVPDMRVTPGGSYRYKLTIQTQDFQHQMAWVKWESYKESRGLTARKVTAPSPPQ